MKTALAILLLLLLLTACAQTPQTPKARGGIPEIEISKPKAAPLPEKPEYEPPPSEPEENTTR